MEDQYFLSSPLIEWVTFTTKKPAVTLVYGLHWIYLNFNMVPMAGVEPARLSPLPPQDSVSTNSTTSAGILLRITATSLLIIQANHFYLALPPAQAQAQPQVHREYLTRSRWFPSLRQ